jgi:predicted kinase
MSKPLLIIVAGPPASGKTTLAQRLACELRLPVIHKDDLKESLFDSLGWKDREWSRKLGIASISLLYYFIEAQLVAGYSHIVECNFNAQYDNAPFLALKQKYDYEPFQIQCRAEGEVLFQRYQARGQSGQRHPGHVDFPTYMEMAPRLLKGFDEPLNLGGTLYTVDTTNFETINYEELITAIRAVKAKVEQGLH